MIAWQSNTPFNSHLIADPSQRVPGFELPKATWTSINRIRTNHGRCAAFLLKWGVVDNASCDCGHSIQTIEHITLDCPLRRFAGTLEDIHICTQEAISWVGDLDMEI